MVTVINMSMYYEYCTAFHPLEERDALAAQSSSGVCPKVCSESKLYVCISFSLSLSLYVCVYIYIYMYCYIHIIIYIYIYIYTYIIIYHSDNNNNDNDNHYMIVCPKVRRSVIII